MDKPLKLEIFLLKHEFILFSNLISRNHGCTSCKKPKNTILNQK